MTKSNNSIVAIIQARMSSTRLPGKVLLDLKGKTVLERVVERTQQSFAQDSVVICTSTETKDDQIYRLAEKIGVRCERGSLMDVRSRFLKVLEDNKYEFAVRVTADNPLVNPHFINALIDELRKKPHLDYAAMDPDAIPYGSGAEAFKVSTFLKTAALDNSDAAKEHVTPAIRQFGKIELLKPAAQFAAKDCRVTVDTPEDYKKMVGWYEKFHGKGDILELVIKGCKSK